MSQNNRPIVFLKIEQSMINHPLSLLFLVNSLRKNNYRSVVMFDQTDTLKPEVLASNILAQNPLFIGVSCITGRQCYDSALVSMAIKKLNPDIPVVWGGIHPTLTPRDTLAQEYVDFVVMGEGEETIVELANQISTNNYSFDQILGLGYKDSGKVVLNKHRPFVNLDDYELEEADWDSIDLERSIYVDPSSGKRFVDFQTSRGCPFNCGFCYNKKFTRRKVRRFSTEVVERMARLLVEKYKVDCVKFVDDNIYFQRKRLFDILTRLKKLGLSTHYLQMRIEDVSEQSINHMAELGVRRLFFGLETGSQRTKEIINKNIPNELIIEKIGLIRQHKELSVTCAFIIGFPGEDDSDIDKTVELAVKITDMHANSVVTLQTYVPFPGSDLYDKAIELGYKHPTSPLGYRHLDTFDGDLDIKWARYRGLQGVRLARRLNLMNKYATMLTHNKGTSLLRTIGKKTLRIFARNRLLHNFYRFPFELGILFRFNRYIRQVYKGKEVGSKRRLTSSIE